MTREEYKELGRLNAKRVAEEILSVQPMDPHLLSDLVKAIEEAKSKKELLAEGYVPVSSLGLLWIKKEQQ